MSKYAITHHSRSNQVLNCFLNCSHVNSSGKVKILVEEITMPVLFGSPSSCPNGPRSRACASFITNTIQGIYHTLICWKGFFSDHIPNKNNKIIIWKLLSPLPQFLDLVMKSIRRRIGQEILWLPAFLHWFQESQ